MISPPLSLATLCHRSLPWVSQLLLGSQPWEVGVVGPSLVVAGGEICVGWLTGGSGAASTPHPTLESMCGRGTGPFTAVILAGKPLFLGSPP